MCLKEESEESTLTVMCCVGQPGREYQPARTGNGALRNEIGPTTHKSVTCSMLGGKLSGIPDVAGLR
ncbi:hypothetical protein E2C01_085429 [Portunus trituberculatus]|uniref:Uncharacterized protein n=1 Tax=Portunus trituberculatus TaxID=210409 RepID=A0A5B7IXT7_PORTR|nr:hypothetical protein [Portunus trituberculatus]